MNKLTVLGNSIKEENENFSRIFIQETKIKVATILDLSWDFVEKLKQKWINDTLDLSTLSREKIFSLVEENQEIYNYLKSRKKLTKEWIISFLQKNWLKRISLGELKSEVFDFFRENWIFYVNELVYWNMWKLMKKMQQNKRIMYFFQKNQINWRETNFSIENVWNLLEKYDFPKLWKSELETKVLIFLSENKIDSSEKIFRNLKILFKKVRENPLIYSYFYNSWINTSSSYEDFWMVLKKLLEGKVSDSSKNLKNFLRDNKIFDYKSLRDFWKTREIRKLLWSESEARKVLEEIWLTKAKDFREEHIIKFARKVWFEDIPEAKKLSEEEVKQNFKNYLKHYNIEDIFSLEHFWLKQLKKWILSEKTLWKAYENFNEFVKKYVWKTISNMSFEDLKILWENLWLKNFSEEEQKERFLKFLELKGLNLSKLTTSNFRKEVWIWENSSVYYFVKKLTWKTRKNTFVTEDLVKIRKYFVEKS